MSTDKSLIFWDTWNMLNQDPDLPYPETEYRFHLERKWRFDFAWPHVCLAVEIDGGQWTAHGGRHMTDKDREKMNAAAALGWRVMHFSPEQLERDPAGCVDLVVRALCHEMAGNRYMA